MTKEYRFNVGDRVRVKPALTRATVDAMAHRGEIVTIAKICPFTYAYELVEYPWWWQDACFEEV